MKVTKNISSQPVETGVLVELSFVELDQLDTEFRTMRWDTTKYVYLNRLWSAIYPIVREIRRKK